ncbi:MAG: helix-turn-helix transcriptional regulator [Halosimplex sp.]
MSESPDPVEQVAFLARSETRVRVLERLHDCGPASQRDLRDRVDASRSTLSRALAALEERGWVEQSGGAYELTPKGGVVAEEFLGLLESIRAVDRLSTFLEWFPYAEFDVDVARFREADVTTASPSDPYAPAREQTQLIDQVERFRGFLPSLDIEGTRVVHDRITEGSFEAEIVLSADAEATVESGEFADLFREQVATGRLTVHVVDGELPFYLGLADGLAQVGVEDDEGFPRALLETTDPAVVDWATDVYDSYRDRARVKRLEDF